MAIHPDFPGLEITVDVNKKAMLEYRDDEDEDSNAYCTNYVEAISGQEFGFALEIDPHVYPYADRHFLVKFYVDGRRIKTKSLTSMEMYQRRPGMRSIYNGVYERTEKGAVRRPLLFSDLYTNEDDATDLWGNLKQLGKIEALCYTARYRPAARWHGDRSKASDEIPSYTRVRDQGSRLPPTDFDANSAENQPYSTIPNGTISEKCLKGQAVSHQTTYGKGVPEPPPNPYTHELIPNGKPFAIFVFKYRSHAALKSLLVLPKSPSPPPEDPMIEDWDVKEVEPFEAHRRAVNPPKNERKRTFDDMDADDNNSEVSEELSWEEYQTKRARLIDEAEVVQLE